MKHTARNSKFRKESAVMNIRKVLYVALWLLSGSATYGQTAEKKTLTLDGAERVIAAANISIGKARTSVLFQKPTKVFEDIINKGRTAMAALPDTFFTPLQGGIPVVLDGQIIGGVGVSGASSAAQDE